VTDSAREPGLPPIALDVVAPGLLTTIQDAAGRSDVQQFGIAHAGALDPLAASVANQLVGNPPTAALLEVTLVGPALQVVGDRPLVFALAGADLGATLDGQRVPPGWSWLARPGATLAFGGQRAGVRAYLAVAGGFDMPLTLGSCATDLRAGFGGLAGRALRAGDRLLVLQPGGVTGLAGRFRARGSAGVDPDRPVRIVPGPHQSAFGPTGLADLCAQPWRISAQADRMGYRLDGSVPLARTRGADVTSLGLPTGAIQVPADGRPIVLLADHQPTGGYTVPACVIQADLPLLAQRGPGDTVSFTLTTFEAARQARLA
jgi:biotin-dependent carboxylase-like uncharacterized protein